MTKLWEFEAPDGTKYEVEGEDKKTAYRALQAAVKKKIDEEYGALPWYGKLGQSAMDEARIGSNFITGGKRDQWAGKLGFADPEAQKYETMKARHRAGSAGTMAEILSAMMLGKFLPEAGPIATGATEGGMFGGLHAAAHDEPVLPGILSGAATGGAVGSGSRISDAVKGIPRNTVMPITREVGKFRLVPHGFGYAGAVGGGGLALQGMTPSTAALTAATLVGVPVAGTLSRSAYKALKESLGKATKSKAVDWSPEVRKALTAIGVLSDEEKK
jgi:hypothetical protein